MADLKVSNTSYPASPDTATAVADGTDTYVAQIVNGPNSAIIALEAELGLALKGSAADLAHRLAINIAADGGIRSGSSFPGTPPTTAHLFYKTDESKLYIYNLVTAAYDAISTATVLAAYIQKDVATTITAVDTFKPTVPGVPFILDANAQGHTVTGFSADTTDLHHLDQDVLTTASPSFVAVTLSSVLQALKAIFTQTTGTAPFTVASTTEVTNLNADQVDGFHASKTPVHDEIVVVGATGTVSLSGGTAIPNTFSYAINDSTGVGIPVVTITVGNTIIIGDSVGRNCGNFYLVAGAGDHTAGFQTKGGVNREIWHAGNLPATAGVVANAATAASVTDGTNNIHTIILPIGAWNMDTTASVTVTHGLTMLNIRRWVVTIKADTNDLMLPLDSPVAEVGNYSEVGTTVFTLHRALNGHFDSNAAFDDGVGGSNRGYIVVDYVV
jgi:hypothetical protein